MKLPVMADRTVSNETLWRRSVDIAFDHAQALGEEAEVGGGRAVVRANAAARPVLVWAELSDSSKADATDFLTRVMAGGTIISTGGHAIDTAARAAGWHSRTRQLVRLTNAKSSAATNAAGTVLPARAALAAVTNWCETRAAADATAVAVLAHLDDPHYDAFALLRDGRPIGIVGLQSRGQTGLVCDAFVNAAERRAGVGITLLHRVIEFAARSQLLDVFATHDEGDITAAAWLAAAGFRAVMPFTAYTVADGVSGVG